MIHNVVETYDDGEPCRSSRMNACMRVLEQTSLQSFIGLYLRRHSCETVLQSEVAVVRPLIIVAA